VNGPALDRQARLRAEVREAIAECRQLGIKDCELRNKSLAELWDLIDHGLRELMRAPRTAA
jgi:hypothetical protein